MGKNYEKRGFELTDKLRQAMSRYRTSTQTDNGKPLSFRQAISGLNMTPMTWYNIESGKVPCASWDSWEDIYRLLLSAKLIDENDVEIMPMGHMRKTILKLREKLQSAVNVGDNNNIKQAAIGTNATVQTGGSFDGVIDAIMSSDMCDGCKIKAYNLIKKAK